jgi:HEAT repeat protein
MIINFFGIRGYIGGIVENYYNIPVISRSSFLGYDKSNRAFQEFKEGPFYRIMLGLMIFLYFWTWYSLIQTSSSVFSRNQAGFNNMQYPWSVFLVLIFGITGYFSRFWGRKVKFRWMDILFAAWLIACVGINVMINFLIPNNDKLADIFSLSPITSPIISGNNYRYFVPSAVIEEFIIVFLITYYILKIRNDFFEKSKYAFVDTSAQAFNPIPLFNFIRDKNLELKNHAKEELVKMYGRIPNKKEYNLLDDKFMNPLFDALSDYNKDSHDAASLILENYLNDHPELISPKIIEALESYNSDKRLNVAELVLENHENSIDIIPYETFKILAKSKDFNIRRIFIDLAGKSTKLAKQIENTILLDLLQDPDIEIQIKTLEFINKAEIDIDPQIILEKFGSSNKRIKTAAILSLNNVTTVESNREFKKMIKSFIQMLDSPDSIKKISAMNALANIGDFKKHKIPYEPFIDGINSHNSNIRISSVKGLKSILKDVDSREESSIQKLLVDKTNNSGTDVIMGVLEVLKSSKKKNIPIIIPLLIQNIKSENNSIQDLVSELIIEMSLQEPSQILEELLRIPEQKTYLKRGVISQTALEIYQNNPKVISSLLFFLNSENEVIRINSANIIAAIAELDSKEIDTQKIFIQLNKEKSAEVKKSLLNAISLLPSEYFESVADNVRNIVKLMEDSDPGVRILASKILVQISKSKPSSVSFDLVVDLTSNKDKIIQENAIKILGNIGIHQIDKTFDTLKKLLEDKDWTVKNSAIEAIYQLGLTSKDIRAINKIIELLDDKEKWTKIKALEITSKIVVDFPDLLPIDRLGTLIKSGESEIRISVAKILGALNESKFEDAFPLIITLMGDSNERVREQASSALVMITKSISMNKILPTTLEYFSDDIDILVQQSMAIALQRIVNYESKEIKKRVGDLLKIRCEISQDPIICKISQDLLK